MRARTLPLLTAAIPDPFAFCAAGFGLWFAHLSGTRDETLEDAGYQQADGVELCATHDGAVTNG